MVIQSPVSDRLRAIWAPRVLQTVRPSSRALTFKRVEDLFVFLDEMEQKHTTQGGGAGCPRRAHNAEIASSNLAPAISPPAVPGEAAGVRIEHAARPVPSERLPETHVDASSSRRESRSLPGATPGAALCPVCHGTGEQEMTDPASGRTTGEWVRPCPNECKPPRIKPMPYGDDELNRAVSAEQLERLRGQR